MGMAASQARYLALTARKSNVEFQGQQINQQRTMLAVEQSELFSELTNLKNPIPPSSIDYEYDVYTFSSEDTEGKIHYYEVKDDTITTDPETGLSSMTVTWSENEVSYEDTIEGEFYGTGKGGYSQLDVINGGSIANIKTGYVDSLKKGKMTDDDAYTDAMNQYNADVARYNQEVERINQKTEQVQIKDRTLELKLRNLDTEQNAIQTELESVKKVIENTIKTVFTTFQSS